MIKINLLPQQSRSRVSNSAKQMTAIAVLAILALVAVLGANFWLAGNVSELENKKTSLKNEYKRLEIRVSKVKDLQKEVDALQDKIAVIRDIRKRQGLPVVYVNQIVEALPASRIWFESFALDNNGRISISGVALDNQSFADYVKVLRQASHIRQVVTQETSRESIQGHDFISFQFRIEAAAPTEEEKEDS
ncbi:MAG: PilN domain-containing protein [Desulfonatronovibrionaceae bacterium]